MHMISSQGQATYVTAVTKKALLTIAHVQRYSQAWSTDIIRLGVYLNQQAGCSYLYEQRTSKLPMVRYCHLKSHDAQHA